MEIGCISKRYLIQQINNSASPPPPTAVSAEGDGIGLLGTTNNFKDLHYAMAGAISSCLTRFLCQPLDILKIRFQLQVEPINKHSMQSKYHSIPQAIALIYREEGFRAFWKGHVPTQLIAVTFGIMQFWSFERTHKMFTDMGMNEHQSMFCSGAIGGSLGILVVNPIDVIRTRLISQDHYNKGYTTLRNAIYKLVVHEGIRGMGRGLIPSLAQVAPLSGFNFMFYNILTLFTSRIQGLERREQSSIYFLINGALAGGISKLICYPMDFLKRRMQIQGFKTYRTSFGQHFVCTSLVNCFRQVVHNEGFSGLYKGITPSLLKASFQTAFNFCFYDVIAKSWKLV